MGFGFRKSVKLGGGVRLNVSKRGVGVSAGGKGMRISTGPSGSRVRASVPGTGLYYEKRLGGNKHRSSQTRYHSLNQQQLQNQRQAELEAAKLEVELFETKVEVLKSVHYECSEAIDWVEKRAEPIPYNEGDIGPNEYQAMQKKKRYKPSLLDKFFNRIEARLRILRENIDIAKEEDQQMIADWKNTKELASEVLNGNSDAYLTVLEAENPFDDIKDLGSELSFKVVNSEIIEVTFNVGQESVIPSQEKSLTQTGKVSTKNMAKGKYYELYQDYVCSCILRFGRELFALLPISKVLIHANTNQLNTATGHLEDGTILSVLLTRTGVESLHIENIDCSDTIESFEHNMKFRKTKGFAFVEPIKIEGGTNS